MQSALESLNGARCLLELRKNLKCKRGQRINRTETDLLWIVDAWPLIGP